MYRGDILILAKQTPIEQGDIIVYSIEGEGIPIVHRVVNIQEDKQGVRSYLTKGDNNPVDDRGLYPRGVNYIREEAIVGKVLGIVPWAGYLTIVLNDYPAVKYTVLGGMLLAVLTSKDPN